MFPVLTAGLTVWKSSSCRISWTTRCKDTRYFDDNYWVYEHPVFYINIEGADMLSNQMKLNYKQKDYLVVHGEYDDSIRWSTSNDSVARISSEGNLCEVYGAKTGTATVYMKNGLDHVVYQCEVTVQYSFWQWLIIIFLFGWAWY